MQITHNIPALRALNSLNKTNLSADKHMRNLSSGLRINTAADDAAGLAISNKMQTQVRGLKRASMNSQDGISLVQTAEGALQEVQNMLQRMRELAVQGANGTLVEEDRRAIQDEVDQLKQQITDTSELTEFNRLKLLNGQLDRRSFTDNEKVSNVAYVSDTVQPGEYAIEVTKVGTKAKADGIDAKFEGGHAGRVNINGEEVDILETDTAEQAFEKLRDVCQRVDLTLTRDVGWGTEAGGKLHIESKEAGKDKYIEINTTSFELLNDLGLVSEPNKRIEKTYGSDAEASLIYKGSDPSRPDYGFEKTATLSATGNRVTITDANYQKVFIDLNVNEEGTALKNGTKFLSSAEMLEAIEKYGQSPNTLDVLGFSFDFAKGSKLNGYTIQFKNDNSGAVNSPEVDVNSDSRVITITGKVGSFTAAKLKEEINKELKEQLKVTNDLIASVNGSYDDTKIGKTPTQESTITEWKDLTPIVAGGCKFEFGDPLALAGYEIEFDPNPVAGPSGGSTVSISSTDKKITIHKYSSGGTLVWPSSGSIKAHLSGALATAGFTGQTVTVTTVSGSTIGDSPLSTKIDIMSKPPTVTIGNTNFIMANDTSNLSGAGYSNILNDYKFVFIEGASGTAVGVDVDSKTIQIKGDHITASGLEAKVNKALKEAGLISGSSTIGLVAVDSSNAELADKTIELFDVDPLIIGAGKVVGGMNISDANKDKLGTLENSEKIDFTVLDAGPLQLQVGPNEGMSMEVQIPKLTSTALGLEFMNMRTAKGASEAISLCDYAINEISAVRSKLGAYQNRLEYTINNLDVTSENTTAALSRIQDADMAEEMAEYTQKNVISQAGINMLSQANQRPQQVLQLLQ